MLVKNNSNEIFMGTGRRKSSIARVTLKPGTGNFQINKLSGIEYMQGKSSLIFKIEAPLTLFEIKNKFDILIKVSGGGLVGQADAIKLAISRALCEFKSDYRTLLKQKGYLTRDARVKERKKYGLKKARKAPQFSKR